MNYEMLKIKIAQSVDKGRLLIWNLVMKSGFRRTQDWWIMLCISHLENAFVIFQLSTYLSVTLKSLSSYGPKLLTKPNRKKFLGLIYTNIYIRFHIDNSKKCLPYSINIMENNNQTDCHPIPVFLVMYIKYGQTLWHIILILHTTE